MMISAAKYRTYSAEKASAELCRVFRARFGIASNEELFDGCEKISGIYGKLDLRIRMTFLIMAYPCNISVGVNNTDHYGGVKVIGRLIN